MPGLQVACACSDGRSGAQRCLADGVFDRCECTGPTPTMDSGVDAAVAFDAGATTDVASADASRDVNLSEGGPSVTLTSGSDRIVDAFVIEAGIIIVRPTLVVIVNRAGAVLRSWMAPREITAAAFDGTWLAVADRAMLNVFDTSLAMMSSTTLREPCVTAAILPGLRFVCGPAGDWDRTFGVHQLPSGAALAASGRFTYEGTPMRRVPGRDDFTTVTTNLSPSDFYLKRLMPDNSIVSFRDSPYHGDFPVTNVYAFIGDPATHVVTHEGILLQIYAPTCRGSTPPGTGACFIRDGNLGTLSTGQTFVGMTEISATQLVGITAMAAGFPPDSLCGAGCAIQRIDANTRTILSSGTLAAPSVQAISVVRYDRWTDRALVAYSLGRRFDPPTGYNVELLSF
ncbi:MAG: hypothetical protein U0269_23140 [Polyangiales bacterium]